MTADTISTLWSVWRYFVVGTASITPSFGAHFGAQLFEDVLYVRDDRTRALVAIDVAEPVHPKLRANISIPNYHLATIARGRLFLADSPRITGAEAARLWIVDLEDPRHPEAVGYVERPGLLGLKTREDGTLVLIEQR